MPAAQDRSLKVFISYASEDLKTVREIVRFLQSQKIEVWFDKDSILPGQDRELEIERGISSADIVITCISSKSITTEGFIQKELRLVHEKALEKPEGTIFVIPIKLDECKPPSFLSKYQWLDWFAPQWKQTIYLSLKTRARQLGVPISYTGSRPKCLRKSKAIQGSTPQSVISKTLLNSTKPEKPAPSENISIKIDGNVQGNIIIGNENAVQTPSAHLESDGLIAIKQHTIEQNKACAIDKIDMQSEIPHSPYKLPVERYWPIIEKKIPNLRSLPNFPKTILGNPFPHDKAENDLQYLFSDLGFFWTDHPLCRILRAKNGFTIVCGEEGSGKTAFARAYGQYLCDKTVLTCYINQPLHLKDIQAQFTKRVLDFVKANPFHLPENANALLLAQWLKTHNKLTIHAWLDNILETLGEAKWIDDVVDNQKKEIYLSTAQKKITEFQELVMKCEEPVFTSAEEMDALFQCGTSLGFKRVRVVFDLGQEPRDSDIVNMDDFLRENQNRIETIIFTQLDSVWHRQFGGNATIRFLRWRQGARNLLEEMILHRWDLVSPRQRPQNSVLESGAFEYLLELSQGNPSQFIRLWNLVIELKSNAQKISVELIDKARR